MPRYHNALARRFFWRFVPPVMVVLLVVALFNLRLSFLQDHQRTETMRRSLVSQYAASLEKPLWDVDLIAARGIVTTLAGIPDVLGVRLSEQADGTIITAGEIPKNRIFSVSREIVYRDENGRTHPVGRLEILFRQLAWQDTFWNGLQVYGVLFLAALVTILLTAGWALRRLVTSPLAKFREAIESQKPGAPLALPGNIVPADELGDVMRAYLSLLGRVQSSIDRRDALRKCAGFLLEPSSESSRPLDNILAVIRETLGADFAQAYELTTPSTGQRLSLLASSGRAGDARLPRTGADARLEAFLSSLEPGIIQGMPPCLHSADVKTLLESYGMNSSAVVRFRSWEDSTLLLIVASHSPRREWAEYDQAFLKTVSDMIESQRLRTAAERETLFSQDQLRAVSDNLPDAFLYQFVAREGEPSSFTYVSEGIRKILGMQPDEVMRRASLLLNMVPPDYRSGLSAQEDESRKNMTDFFYETPLQFPDGKLRWAQLSARPKKQPDGSIIWQGIHRDITESRMAEEQLQKSRDALASANAALEQAIRQAEALAREAAAANSAKSQFIANMSHEIRTPMNAIIGFSEILAGSLRDADKREKALIIADSGRQLLALVNDILDLSKIEAGQIEFQPTAFSPAVMATEIREFFRHLASKKSLRLDLEIAPDLPARLVSDELRLRQILNNLVGNAIKFTQTGSVILRVSSRNSNRADGAILFCFEVIDTGPGIPPENRKDIFDDFIQLDSSNPGGTGLGLSISRRLALLLGGSISVAENPEGQGSAFLLEIPSFDSSEIAPSLQSTADTAGQIAFDSLPLVLIVDDGKVNRQLMKAYLSGHGFRVIEATNGNEALAQVTKHRPGIILTDIRMPGMDGREFFRALRSLPDKALSQTPVIAVTAAAMRSQSLEDRKLFDGFLLKPVSQKELITEVARFLPHHRVTDAVMEDTEEAASFEHCGKEFCESLKARALIVKKHLRVKDVIELADILKSANGGKKACPLTDLGTTLDEAARHFQVDRIKLLVDRLIMLIDRALAGSKESPLSQ